MRKTERVFSQGERKTAMWALLLAAVIATMGLLVEQMIQPSVGTYGEASYDFAPTPGAMDAQPIGDVANPFNAPA